MESTPDPSLAVSDKKGDGEDRKANDGTDDEKNTDDSDDDEPDDDGNSNEQVDAKISEDRKHGDTGDVDKLSDDLLYPLVFSTLPFWTGLLVM